MGIEKMNTKTVEELQAEIEALKRERDGWEAAACDYSELKQMLNDTKRQLAESQANLKLSDNRREELASRKHQLELDLAEAQAKITHDVDEEWMNEVDEEWLDEIAKRWNELTGKPWDPLAGETREEGLQANVGALFNYIEESRAALAKSEAAGAVMREACGNPTGSDRF
jgi:DNA repair exonuclease SbcCD ATPase subunit